MKRNFRLLVLLFFLLLASRAEAQVGFPYCESFQNESTFAQTLKGGSVYLSGGVLGLTTNQENQKGYVYIDVPFPSKYGIKVEFEYFMYGGTGADGLTVFLFDAEVSNFAPGGFGGSLGYAQRDNVPGLTGAYLGLGFDAFGNFGNASEGKQGGFFGGALNLYKNSIVIRKGGSGISGYQFVTGKMTQDPPPGSPELGLDVQYRFPLSSGGVGTQRVDDPQKVGYRKVFLELEPHSSGTGYVVKLEMEVTTEAGKPRLVTIFPGFVFPYAAPKDLKIGFAASTGGSTNFHEIRNLVVEVSADGELKDPEGSDFTDFTSCAGQKNQYYITEEEVVLPNENSEIRCLQFYESIEEIESDSEDICSKARCLEQNRYLILPQGTFEASDQAGGFTFFPNEEYIGQEVTAFYTVTDSYGKSSKGNSITLKIEESPMPIKLSVSPGSEVLDFVNICPGESVDLGGSGEEVYERFEWYKDGQLIEGAFEPTFTASEVGEYEVKGYNRKNCPAVSNKVRIAIPEFQDLAVDSPLMGCTPGQPVDVTVSISGYDSDKYDYQLSGLGKVWLNDEMKSISQTGNYELKIKEKNLDCYSDPIEVEVIILDKALVANFEFEVQGTGITGDADGGIFPDDLIQFSDLSDEEAISWVWDFGDGATSTDQNPTHVYGKKGEFEIVLVIKNEFGCESRITKKLSIARSYRLMIPTGFTPTLTENKTFVPKYKGLVSMELLIFNTWGELIFQTSDLNTAGWDGTLEGKLMDAGVFVFRFNGVSTDGEKVSEAGKFNLIR